jgi:hypothetical protein
VPLKNLPSSSLLPSFPGGNACPRNTSGMNTLWGAVRRRCETKRSDPWIHQHNSATTSVQRDTWARCDIRVGSSPCDGVSLNLQQTSPEAKDIINDHNSMLRVVRSRLCVSAWRQNVYLRHKPVQSLQQVQLFPAAGSPPSWRLGGQRWGEVPAGDSTQ